MPLWTDKSISKDHVHHPIQLCLPTRPPLVPRMGQSRGAIPPYYITLACPVTNALLISQVYQLSSLIKLSSTPHTHKTSTPESQCAELDQQIPQNPSSSSSASVDEHELSTSPIASYLKDPATSHVEPHHTSPQESARIYTERLSYLQGVDKTLKR